MWNTRKAWIQITCIGDTAGKQCSSNIKSTTHALFAARCRMELKHSIFRLDNTCMCHDRMSGGACMLQRIHRAQHLFVSYTSAFIPRSPLCFPDDWTRSNYKEHCRKHNVCHIYVTATSAVLKVLSYELCTPMYILFKMSIDNGTCPLLWKKANITPIYKKWDASQVSNYRPISILPAMCRLFERILADDINFHLHHNRLITDAQYGFVKAKMWAISSDTHQLHYIRSTTL